jgi:mannitol-specific phosphotransferase system IIBC component
LAQENTFYNHTFYFQTWKVSSAIIQDAVVELYAMSVLEKEEHNNVILLDATMVSLDNLQQDAAMMFTAVKSLTQHAENELPKAKCVSINSAIAARRILHLIKLKIFTFAALVRAKSETKRAANEL